MLDKAQALHDENVALRKELVDLRVSSAGRIQKAERTIREQANQNVVLTEANSYLRTKLDEVELHRDELIDKNRQLDAKNGVIAQEVETAKCTNQTLREHQQRLQKKIGGLEMLVDGLRLQNETVIAAREQLRSECAAHVSKVCQQEQEIARLEKLATKSVLADELERANAEIVRQRRIIEQFIEQVNRLRRERTETNLETQALQEKLDAQTRTVSNNSQIKYLQELQDTIEELRVDLAWQTDLYGTMQNRAQKAEAEALSLFRQLSAKKRVTADLEDRITKLIAGNGTLRKDLDDRDARIGLLAKRVRDYHEALGELIDEVQDLEQANGAATDLIAEMREDRAMAQFEKIKARQEKEAPPF